MFETPLVDDTYELWPFNFEIYIILAYKVLPKDYDTFDIVSPPTKSYDTGSTFIQRP